MKRKLVNDKTKKELKELKSHKYYIDFYDCFKNDDKTLLRIISDHINDLVFCNLDNAKSVPTKITSEAPDAIFTLRIVFKIKSLL